ncbi:hypothetical protein K438DRAFT_1130160 [Mycena galopus ATCC 62051]|nr:hypothetical protein K438DRAFT_1130160 [Mycena galopus ATCC 62051]
MEFCSRQAQTNIGIQYSDLFRGSHRPKPQLVLQHGNEPGTGHPLGFHGPHETPTRRHVPSPLYRQRTEGSLGRRQSRLDPGGHGDTHRSPAPQIVRHIPNHPRRSRTLSALLAPPSTPPALPSSIAVRSSTLSLSIGTRVLSSLSTKPSHTPWSPPIMSPHCMRCPIGIPRSRTCRRTTIHAPLWNR